jgi:hypothetical protein
MNCAAGVVEHIGRIHGVDQHVFFRFGLELLKSNAVCLFDQPGRCRRGQVFGREAAKGAERCVLGRVNLLDGPYTTIMVNKVVYFGIGIATLSFLLAFPIFRMECSMLARLLSRANRLESFPRY